MHVVARIGKAHGLRGEVTVQVHTDAPERFEPGVAFHTEPAAAGPLTLRSVRDHNGILLLAFEQATNRTAAEALRGTRLLLDPDVVQESEEDTWYAADLVGLRAVSPAGAELGTVTALESRPAQDLLVLRLADGREGYVPFVRAIVPEVDVAGGRVVIDAPDGLFDLSPGMDQG